MQNFNTLQTVAAFPFRCADQASNISMQGPRCAPLMLGLWPLDLSICY